VRATSSSGRDADRHPDRQGLHDPDHRQGRLCRGRHRGRRDPDRRRVHQSSDRVRRDDRLTDRQGRVYQARQDARDHQCLRDRDQACWPAGDPCGLRCPGEHPDAVQDHDRVHRDDENHRAAAEWGDLNQGAVGSDDHLAPSLVATQADAARQAPRERVQPVARVRVRPVRRCVVREPEGQVQQDAESRQYLTTRSVRHS